MLVNLNNTSVEFLKQVMDFMQTMLTESQTLSLDEKLDFRIEIGKILYALENETSLWHPAKDVPRVGQECIVYTDVVSDQLVTQGYSTSTYTPEGWSTDFFPRGYSVTVRQWADRRLFEMGFKKKTR